MAYDSVTNVPNKSPYLEKLCAEKKAGFEIQKRKHNDWDSNYELYRNKVKTNRLTQRQAVNIPLMKETVKTLLSKIDEPPNVEWEELGSDEAKEIVYQEVWNENYNENKFELVDILEKKNVLLYGFSVKKLNIADNGIDATPIDPYDIVFDPQMSPSDIETARFVIHQNIFRSIRDILADERYTEKGKDELKIWAETPEGMTQSAKNKETYEERMRRLISMGIDHGDFPYYAGGDRVVNLTEHYTRVWDVKGKKFVRKVCVYAEDTVLLMDETLKDLIGVDFWPFTYWAEDPETLDCYPDSVADLIRPINKVINVWFSQLIENRTLKNFQMHWFLPSQSYTPQTYTPGPGVMLPAPPGDDINKVIKPVEISGLDDTLEAINAITQIAERGSGATAIEKGESDKGTQTLGEVNILVGKAMERTVGMAKFYRMAWDEFARKWDKMMHANAPKFVKLSKTGRSGKVYFKRVYAGDWKSDVGYKPIVRSSSEQEQESMKGIQKFMFILQQFPDNVALRKIAQKRMLELVDLTPEELKQVAEAEEQKMQMMAQQMQAQGMPQEGMQPQQIPSPIQPQQPQQQPQEAEEIASMLNQLATV